MPTIGVNYLSSERPLWFTLADSVGAAIAARTGSTFVRFADIGPSIK
jgi:hypothetical protein